MPVELSASGLLDLLKWGWSVVAALGVYIWKSQDSKIESIRQDVKMFREDLEGKMEAQRKDTNAELDRHRDVMAKMFDKLESHAQRSEDRHRELMMALHTGLAQKADKH